MFISSFYNRGTRWEILKKRPKNNNKAWIKLSEANLSILGDCWEKFVSSSLPASLTKEFPASMVLLHLHPETWLTGKFPRRRMSRRYWPVWVWGHKEKFRPSVCLGGGGGRGGWVRQWVWQKGAIHPFSRKEGGTFWQLKQSNYSRQEIPSDAQNCLFPQNTFLLWTYYYLNISQQAKIGLKNRYFEGQIHFVPLSIATILTILPLRKKTLTFPGFSLKS